MRTTLKRGIGRGAAVNGNGRAVLPPVVLSPITLYRQPEQRRGRLQLVGKILFWLAAAAVSLATAFAGGAYLYLEEDLAAGLSARSADLRKTQRKLNVPLPGRPAIALVVGYDKRFGDEKLGIQARSDTLMLLRADPQTDTITMLSFPRDFRAEIRCPGRTYYHDKINQAYANCGLEGTVETVRALTQVPINYLLTVNFRGFKQIVNELEGVWMDVDRRYFNDRGGPFGYATIDIQPGYQRLNANDALDYVRYRHTDSDLYRNARQQRFVQAVKEQIAGSFSITTVGGIVNAIKRNVQIGQGGGGKLSGTTILRYAHFAYGLPPGHFVQTRIQELYDLPGTTMLTTDPSNVQTAIREFLSPDVEAPEKATAVALGRKLKRKTGPPPREVTIVPLNGNGVEGSASNAGSQLAQRGYQILAPLGSVPANAPDGYGYFRTKVYFGSGVPSARIAAEKVASLFGSADVVRMPPKVAAMAGQATLAVVVGQTYHGTLAPTPVDQTPKRQAPSVVRDPASTRPLLLPLRRKVDFPLALPTVIERYSRPDTEMPVRVYTTAGHKTLRLTYRMFRDGVNQYWGIQQTDWDEAPALSERNTRQTIAGRQYDLYYSGPRLHMVVLRQNGTTYWVVNTLLDNLSNETMLAIAKGLRPLR